MQKFFSSSAKRMIQSLETQVELPSFLCYLPNNRPLPTCLMPTDVFSSVTVKVNGIWTTDSPAGLMSPSVIPVLKTLDTRKLNNKI